MERLKYKITTTVYHISDGTRGVVIDANYCYSTGKVTYTVAYSSVDITYCQEWELSDTKIVY
jgi:hypothetical protein